MRMNVRRGAIAGISLSFILAASVAAYSSTPLQTFIYTLAVALAMALLALGVLTLIDRRRARNEG